MEEAYIRTYNDWDFDKNRFNFVIEGAYGDAGVYVSFPVEGMDILSFILLIKMLANELTKTFEEK